MTYATFTGPMPLVRSNISVMLTSYNFPIPASVFDDDRAAI